MVRPGYREARDIRTGLTVWCSAGAAAGVARVLPDVHSDLIFWRGSLYLAGYDTVAHHFSRGRAEATYGVRLPPGVLSPLLGDSAAQATDRRVPLDSSAQRVVRARSVGALADIARQLIADAAPDADVSRSARAVLTQAQAGSKVATIAAELGWSTRRLHRFCMTTFGMPAALLRGVYRFRTANTLLAAGVSLGAVAAQAGYADQAHLTRETRRYAFTTPARIHTPDSARDPAPRLE